MNDNKVPEAWGRLIAYCGTRLPYGEITLKIVNGIPTELLFAKAAVRFDKPWASPEYPFPEPNGMVTGK